MKSILLGGCLFGVALVVACGDGGTTPDDGVGGASTGGGATGGAATGGGSSSGGAASGGTASGGGATEGGFCTPGVTEDGGGVYPYPIDNCGKVDGITDQDDVAYRDITLDTPIGPGDSYAFSAHMGSSEGKFEIWGATEKCGAPGELLDSFENTRDGTICLEAKPQTGTYSHLIWVWYVGATQEETRFCEGGVCPTL